MIGMIHTFTLIYHLSRHSNVHTEKFLFKSQKEKSSSNHYKLTSSYFSKLQNIYVQTNVTTEPLSK